jgi:hypothetical protein
MSTMKNKTVSETLDAHRQALILDQRAMKGVMLGAGYIVTSHSGSPLAFDTVTEGGVTKVTTGHHCGYGKWSMFTKQDAERVAANTFDGNGMPGRALHINDYLKESLELVEGLLESLSKS